MTVNYLEVLKVIHEQLGPRTYLEIGVQHGKSISLSQCDSIGIDADPKFTVNCYLNPGIRTDLYHMTSDEYFERAKKPGLGHMPFSGSPIDFAFIDGMHLFEYALRDFINIEKHSGPGTLVAIDDVLPREKSWAARERKTKRWTGDVWKIVPALQYWRPDLKFALIDSDPAGTMLLWNLDPSSTRLNDNFSRICSPLMKGHETPPPRILERKEAVSFDQWIGTGALNELKGIRGSS